MIALSSASACVRRTEAAPEFAPVVGPVPAGISARLEVDSTISVAPSPMEPATIGASDGSCAYALRDPRTGARFMLAESASIETRVDTGATGSVSTKQAQANYLPSSSDIVRLPAERYLRVACGTNDVLGLAKALTPPE